MSSRRDDELARQRRIRQEQQEEIVVRKRELSTWLPKRGFCLRCLGGACERGADCCGYLCLGCSILGVVVMILMGLFAVMWFFVTAAARK